MHSSQWHWCQLWYCVQI